MRRKTLTSAVCILMLVALVLLPTFGLTGMLGLTQSGPMYHEENIYATYEFNTLKNPTGLLGLTVNVATGGSTYTTRFRLYIADSGNHLIRYLFRSSHQRSWYRRYIWLCQRVRFICKV